MLPLKGSAGEIVSTMLDADLFLAINSPGWILADGGKAPTGSDYEKRIGPDLPDLRGIFLRGKNYERPRETGNAEGDLPLGTYQKGAIEKHTHTYNQMVHNDNVDGVDSATTHSFEHHNEKRQTGETGGEEVRPNCVTVNFFICVNDSA